MVIQGALPAVHYALYFGFRVPVIAACALALSCALEQAVWRTLAELSADGKLLGGLLTYLLVLSALVFCLVLAE